MIYKLFLKLMDRYKKENEKYFSEKFKNQFPLSMKENFDRVFNINR